MGQNKSGGATGLPWKGKRDALKDIVFLDRKRTILRMDYHVKPFRGMIAVPGAVSVLEVRAGACDAHLLQIGMKLEWYPLSKEATG